MVSPFAAGQQGARLQKAKSDYGKMMNKRQPGGIASIPSSGKKAAFVQLQKQKFFGDRPDISEDRVLRRTRQEGALNQFKQSLIDKGRVLTGTRADGSTYTVMNPNTGEPVFLTDRPGGRSVSDVAQDLAFRFGPTPSEVAGDIGRGLGSMIKGAVDFGTSGGLTGAIVQGVKDLLTDPVGTTKRIGYGVQDMTKGYDPFTKQDVGIPPKIETQPLPSLDLEAKMSAYEDPIKYYAGKQKTDKPNVMIADAGDAAQNYMNLLKNVQNLGKTQYGNFGVQDILSSPTLTYEKEIGPGTLSGTIGDNKASLGYSMIFNKGGRVRGTGIMGAL